MLKDKRVLIGVIAVILIIAAGSYFLIVARNTANQEAEEEETIEEDVAILSPEDVGLEMEAMKNNQQIVFRITKPDGITAVEYELTYVAEDEQQRGVIGTIEDLDTSSDVIESKPLDLGSCSSGVCKYDKGVKSVDLLLKVTKDGKDYQVQETLELE